MSSWLQVLLLCALAPQAPFVDHAADHIGPALEAASKESLDGSDFAEPPAYRELVAALLELKPIDVAAKAPAPFDFAQALAEPASVRGKWVRASGHAVGQRPIALQTPVGSVKNVQRIILKLDLERGVICDLIGDPPPFKNTDTVQVDGVFFRTVTYQNDRGNLTTLPYLLVRSMEVIETPSSALGKSLLNGGPQLYAGVLFGLVGVLVLVLYLRRSSRDGT